MNTFHNSMRLFYINLAERLIRLSNWHYARLPQEKPRADKVVLLDEIFCDESKLERLIMPPSSRTIN